MWSFSFMTRTDAIKSSPHIFSGFHSNDDNVESNCINLKGFRESPLFRTLFLFLQGYMYSISILSLSLSLSLSFSSSFSFSLSIFLSLTLYLSFCLPASYFPNIISTSENKSSEEGGGWRWVGGAEEAGSEMAAGCSFIRKRQWFATRNVALICRPSKTGTHSNVQREDYALLPSPPCLLSGYTFFYDSFYYSCMVFVAVVETPDDVGFSARPLEISMPFHLWRNCSTWLLIIYSIPSFRWYH